jgi:hypothetical protein
VTGGAGKAWHVWYAIVLSVLISYKVRVDSRETERDHQAGELRRQLVVD